MDWFDDVQVEELCNFDFIEDEEVFEVLNKEEKNFNDYLNSNYDYWLTMNSATVLAEMKELREIWRKQSFSLSNEQQAQYNKLLELRRQRVRELYENDMVYKYTATK